jgi:hypothetical protein
VWLWRGGGSCAGVGKNGEDASILSTMGFYVFALALIGSSLYFIIVKVVTAARLPCNRLAAVTMPAQTLISVFACGYTGVGGASVLLANPYVNLRTLLPAAFT